MVCNVQVLSILYQILHTRARLKAIEISGKLDSPFVL